jgi:hypothetical protein
MRCPRYDTSTLMTLATTNGAAFQPPPRVSRTRGGMTHLQVRAECRPMSALSAGKRDPRLWIDADHNDVDLLSGDEQRRQVTVRNAVSQKPELDHAISSHCAPEIYR